jgi:hypothetical protein
MHAVREAFAGQEKLQAPIDLLKKGPYSQNKSDISNTLSGRKQFHL